MKQLSQFQNTSFRPILVLRYHVVVSRGAVLKMAHLLLILLLFSTSVSANEDTGSVYFGQNLAKPFDEHTDRIYLKIDNSEKLYFNRKYDGPVLENLDLNKDHDVKVYFDNKVVQSWILNYSKRKTHSVLIWRSAGSWRMEAIVNSNCACNYLCTGE